MGGVRVIVWLVLAVAGVDVLGQGTIRFAAAITGFETRGEGVPEVRGFGTLELSTTSNRSDGSLAYVLTVPISRNFPVEAHFHGPAIGGENPIISLAAYELVAGGIRYEGEAKLERKWIADFEAGRWYINLHNPEYNNALISGFIVLVPEPKALAIAAAGAALLGYARASSRKR